MSLGAAGIIGGASLLGGLLQSNAATQAAQMQQQTAMAEMQLAQQNLGPILGQGHALSASVMPQLQALLTPGQSAAALSSLPGYQWALGQTQKATANYGTTMGLGGNALYGMAQNVTGLNQGYENQYYQQLSNALGMGLQTETNAAGTLTGSQQAALGQYSQAGAAGILGSANAMSNALGGVSTAAILGSLGSGGLFGNNALGTPVGPATTEPYVGQSGFGA